MTLSQSELPVNYSDGPSRLTATGMGDLWITQDDCHSTGEWADFAN
jgi:hypothetical protein